VLTDVNSILTFYSTSSAQKKHRVYNYLGHLQSPSQLSCAKKFDCDKHISASRSRRANRLAGVSNGPPSGL